MATKRVPLIRVDEDYIDMVMSPYANQPQQQQNKDMLMPLPKLPYNSNAPFGFVRSQSCRSGRDFPKKLKHAKNFWLVLKLNSYKAYIKSLFTKTACSADKFSVVASSANNAAQFNKPRKSNHFENSKRKSFENFHDVNQNRRSSSSTFSINLDGNNNVSMNSEMEGSVVEAIAYCKQSQMKNGSNKDSHA